MCVLLVVVCLLFGGCSYFVEDDWLGEDKVLYFVSFVVFVVVGMQMVYDCGLCGVCQVCFGLSFLFVFGVGKEFYDSCFVGSGWSWKDFVWDLVGVVVGYSFYQVVE